MAEVFSLSPRDQSRGKWWLVPDLLYQQASIQAVDGSSHETNIGKVP
jgi:hypothetical protein